ncbi:aspartate aminotransferase-like [Branchiostoma floridae x Branchiostoma japonicum]
MESNHSSLLRPDLANYRPASNLMLNEKIRTLRKAGEKVYHLAFGQSPFPIYEGAIKALRQHAGENKYLPVAGIPELRQSICEFHCKADDLQDLDPEQVVVGPGSKQLIYLLLEVFNGDVLLLSPCWVTYKPQCHLTRHNVVMMPTTMEDEWRLTPELLEETLRTNDLHRNKLLILCNPDNPTGTCYNPHHLKQLSSIFRKHGIVVLSDEIYARLHYTDSHESIAKYYPEGTILCSGLSKWAGAGGWRLGYCVFPRELDPLRCAVKSAASHTHSCASAPIQYAAITLFSYSDGVQEYRAHCSRILQAAGTYSCKELRSVGVKVVQPTSGFYILPNFEVLRKSLSKRGITTCTQMCEALFEEARVALLVGPDFHRPLDEFTTRLCFVDFDGSHALKASKELGLDVPLSDEFVKEYCGQTYDGIQSMKRWVQTQLEAE